jgi:hypothetical protein
MEDEAADKLHVEMAHPCGTHARFSDGRKRCGHQLVKDSLLFALAVFLVARISDGARHALLKLCGACAQLFIRKLFNGWLKLVDAPDDGLNGFKITLVAAAENFGQKLINHDF